MITACEIAKQLLPLIPGESPLKPAVKGRADAFLELPEQTQAAIQHLASKIEFYVSSDPAQRESWEQEVVEAWSTLVAEPQKTSCNVCRFFVEGHSSAGRCHRFPPAVVYDAEYDIYATAEQPAVLVDHWCGEFEANQ